MTIMFLIFTLERSVVILDNASIHHIDSVVELIEDHAGARVMFLPPYSPDLNPLEAR